MQYPNIRIIFLKFEEIKTKNNLNTSIPVDWRREARRLLRAQLALKDMGYKELARALESVGIDESAKALSNKIGRGTFSFSFFLQCMRALDIDRVVLRE